MLETVLFVRPTFLLLSASLVLLAAFFPQRVPAVRCGIAAGVFVVSALVDYLLVDTFGLTTVLEPLLHLAAIFLLGVLVFRRSPPESVYYTAWCYLLSRMASQLLMPWLSKLDNTFLLVLFKLAVYAAAEAVLYGLTRKYLVPVVCIGRSGPARQQSLLLACSLLTASLVFPDHHFLKWLMYGSTTVDTSQGNSMISIFRLLFDLLCLVVLYMQCGLEHTRTMEQELFTVRQLWQHQQAQYERSRENIELINQKCHDMKYQIRALRSMESSAARDEQIREMERSIMIYDTAMKTGDPVLDTVLTEKSLFCEKHGITLTCMADGDGLRFMSSTDLYTILGNALDNAIEHVLTYPEQEKRVIQVSVLPKGTLHVIRVRNYCEKPPVFADGLPASTKEHNGYHGFGLKSIRMIAERYNGSISCSWQDQSFLLLILLAAPET